MGLPPGLEEDDLLVIMWYTMEDPYPWFKLLNAWMYINRRDDTVKKHIGPMARLLITALLKLPPCHSEGLSCGFYCCRIGPREDVQ